ncbi:MAG: hypothetical protein KA807_15120 [Prolixibacteraceae bacterium]|nr:hypothetical protein [Prolixibacteraceae bacterium]
MKKGVIIVIVLLCAFTIVKAQDTIQGFIFPKDGSVIWQHEFTTQERMDDLFNSIIENRVVTEYEIFGNHLSGIMPQISARYELAGFKKIKTPNYILAYDCTANVLIQYKPGKYRVTLHRIRMVNNGSDYSFTNPINLLEDYALNKKGVSKAFRKSSAYILNTTFVDYFSNIKLFDDEW